MRHYLMLRLPRESCLLVPSMLGGFPIIYYHNMWVRVESDLLSPFLGMLLFAKDTFHEAYPYMSNFCYSPQSEIKDRDLLFRDPYALPSIRPPLPTSGLRQKILPALKNITKNEHVKELMLAATDPQ